MAKPTLETIFEKRRGVSRVEVRHGFAQVHVSRIEPPVMEDRLRVLEAVSSIPVSIDFLKLTPSGLSFMIPDDSVKAVDTALSATGLHYSIRENRSIVLVYAVSIRDEEGLIATILKQTIASRTRIDHVGDMHDRMLMVVKTEDVEDVVKQFSDSEVSR